MLLEYWLAGPLAAVVSVAITLIAWRRAEARGEVD